MDQDYISASAGQTLGERERRGGIRKGARRAWRRLHWGSEDTLALVIAAIGVLVILFVLLQP
ncbi:MAG TPA: hypothetical protein VFB23_13530 [Candidatus Acidoferrales bacterium]|jgi:hypothetical protein|nr:hypothetical protein [Candidatus Acidoferrales bacterium]